MPDQKSVRSIMFGVEPAQGTVGGKVLHDHTFVGQLAQGPPIQEYKAKFDKGGVKVKFKIVGTHRDLLNWVRYAISVDVLPPTAMPDGWEKKHGQSE